MFTFSSVVNAAVLWWSVGCLGSRVQSEPRGAQTRGQ